MPTLPPRRPRRGPVRESLSPEKLQELTGVGPARPDYNSKTGGTATPFGTPDSNGFGSVPFKWTHGSDGDDLGGQGPRFPPPKPYR